MGEYQVLLARVEHFVRNFPGFVQALKIKHGARWASKLVQCLTVHGELRIVQFQDRGKATPRVVDLGLVGAMVVTNAGVTFLRDDFNNGGQEISNMNFHEIGTGTNAEAVGDVALQTPSGLARVAGTRTVPAANQFRSEATTTNTGGALAITEHGLFSASTAGTLWDRTQFAAVNLATNDSLLTQYTLTINAGG
jgi:hypothetical protein